MKQDLQCHITMFNGRYKTTSINGKTSRPVSYGKPWGIFPGACHSWPRALNCLLNKVGSCNEDQVAVVRRVICGNACRERPMRVEVWADRKSILDHSLDWAYCMLNSFLSMPHDLFLLLCSRVLPFICVWTEWRCLALQKPDRWVSPQVRVGKGKWKQTLLKSGTFSFAIIPRWLLLSLITQTMFVR